MVQSFIYTTMRKFKVINARAKSQIGQVIEIRKSVLDSADTRNSGGDLKHLLNFNVVNPLTDREYGKFEIYQYEGDGDEWSIKFSNSGAGSTWYVVEEISEESKDLPVYEVVAGSVESIAFANVSEAPAFKGNIKQREVLEAFADLHKDGDLYIGSKSVRVVDEKNKVTVRASNSGGVRVFVRGLSANYLVDTVVNIYLREVSDILADINSIVENAGAKEEPEVKSEEYVKENIKKGNRSAFGTVVYLDSSFNVLKKDTIGEPLGQVGKFYFIGGLRYKVKYWVFDTASNILTFKLQLCHTL